MPRLAEGYIEARRQEILEAARQVFVDKGYAAATMQDIANVAGVATGSIYRYFESKADLIAEVVEHCAREDVERWRVDAAGVTPGQQLLSLGAITRADFLQDGHREEATLRIESYLAAAREADLQTRLVATLDQSVAELAGYIERAQASGEFDGSLDAQDLSRFLHAAASGFGAMLVAYGEQFPTDRMWDLLIHLVGQGLSAELREAAAAATRGQSSM